MTILTSRDLLEQNKVDKVVGTWLGTQRQKIAEKNDTRDRLHAKGRDPLQNHIHGAQAELAICRALNIYPDLQLTGDGGRDCRLPDGRTVDVKWHAPWDGDELDLMVELHKIEKPAAIYILTYGTTGYHFEGWCPKQQVFRPDRITDLGNGPLYLVPNAVLQKRFILR